MSVVVRRIRKLAKKVPTVAGTSFWTAFSSAYTFGATLMVSMALFGGLGYLVDDWLGTLPTFTIGLAVVGIFLAFRVLIKDITRRRSAIK
ncbi:AtpZ/AtpI family protein [Coprothermobacteraceae bacterium]|nr:AtpZ/AtpI family protein [Coprothermobacteraceae bacterium]